MNHSDNTHEVTPPSKRERKREFISARGNMLSLYFAWKLGLEYGHPDASNRDVFAKEWEELAEQHPTFGERIWRLAVTLDWAERTKRQYPYLVPAEDFWGRGISEPIAQQLFRDILWARLSYPFGPGDFDPLQAVAEERAMYDELNAGALAPIEPADITQDLLAKAILTHQLQVLPTPDATGAPANER